MNSNDGARPPQTVKKIYIEAYACDDDGDGPEWAEITDPSSLLGRIVALQRVVHEHNLSEARVYLAPDVWGPAGVEEELRLRGEELVVTSDSFRFTCHPKHADYQCETRAQGITDFMGAFSAGETGVLYLGSSPNELAERVQDEAEDGLEVIYLANATGDETGYGTLDVTDEDLDKVPFESGPGVVIPYLTEIGGKKYVQGNLELCFSDEFWGDYADQYDSEEDVRAYCEAVQTFIRPRLIDGALLLPLDDGYPGRFIVQVAVLLDSVADRADALRKLGVIFGTTADEAEVSDFADLPELDQPAVRS